MWRLDLRSKWKTSRTGSDIAISYLNIVFLMPSKSTLSHLTLCHSSSLCFLRTTHDEEVTVSVSLTNTQEQVTALDLMNLSPTWGKDRHANK